MSHQAMKRHGGTLNVKEAVLNGYILYDSGYILYDSNYVTFGKRQNYGDSKKSNGCQG